MEYSGLNDNQITVEAGISNGLIGKARQRGKGLSQENISKILYKYPDLNADWLMTGRGPMLRDGAARHIPPDTSGPSADVPDQSTTIAQMVGIHATQTDQIKQQAALIQQKDNDILKLKDEICELKIKLESRTEPAKPSKDQRPGLGEARR